MTKQEYQDAIEAEEWVVVHTPTGDASAPAPLAATLATRRKLGTRFHQVHHTSALAYSKYRGYYVAAGRSPRYGEESSNIVRAIADRIGGVQLLPRYEDIDGSGR